MRNTAFLVALIVLGTATLGDCLPEAARASQHVALQTRFIPDRLGKATTIEFGFRVSSLTLGKAPSPVTEVSLDLPAGLGLATSTLGLAQCTPSILLEQGPSGCPANSRVGTGTARAELPSEGEVLTETAVVQALLGPPVNEAEQVLFYAEANTPVSAQLVFPGLVLLAPSARYGGRLDTAIPLIPTWIDGPDIAVTSFSSTLGPLGLTYYRHIHGKIVPFKPKGIAVPTRCPRGGFPFRADFTFLDGTRASTTSTVACPGA
ncbi:MAG TPA: hypothetical protein VGI24_12805 [Solirubrobacteraceae bacterium]|jgi:hypothetical protein